MKIFDRRRFLKMLGVGAAAAPIAAAAIDAAPPAGGLGDFILPTMPPPADPRIYPAAPNFRAPFAFRRHFDLIDRRPWSLYCRQRSPAGAMSRDTYVFFNDPLSPTRDFSDTNMRKHGCLPPPQQFLIGQLFFLFSPSMTSNDRDAIMDSYYFRLSVGSKCISEGPLARFPNVVDLTMIEREVSLSTQAEWNAHVDRINDGAPTADAYISVAKTREEIAAAIGDEPAPPPAVPVTLAGFSNCYEHREPIGRKTKVPLGKYAPFKVDLSEHPYVIEPGASLLVEVIGEPFPMDPAGRGDGANFFAVLDGVMDFPIQ